jgi:hypothetical protein
MARASTAQQFKSQANPRRVDGHCMGIEEVFTFLLLRDWDHQQSSNSTDAEPRRQPPHGF